MGSVATSIRRYVGDALRGEEDGQPARTPVTASPAFHARAEQVRVTAARALDGGVDAAGDGYLVSSRVTDVGARSLDGRPRPALLRGSEASRMNRDCWPAARLRVSPSVPFRATMGPIRTLFSALQNHYLRSITKQRTVIYLALSNTLLCRVERGKQGPQSARHTGHLTY